LRVIGAITTAVREIVRLYNVLKTVATSAAVFEALATGGASAVPALAGAALVGGAGLAAGLYTDKVVRDALGGMGAEIPTTGGGAYAPGGATGPGRSAGAVPGATSPFATTTGSAINGVAAALGALLQGRADMNRQQAGWLGEIANNTRRTFEALDLRAETLGGGALARMGVTGAERRSEVMSDAVARFSGATVTVGGSVLERQIRKVIGDEMRRTGGRPVRRS
jgi:hypothetical protein